MQLFQAKHFLILSFAFCVLRHAEGTTISAMGCYKDEGKDRALELLDIYRRPGGKLEWNNLSTTVIKKCKEKAEEEGYECFAIQFYGECWSGEDACENYDMYGESEECFCSGRDFEPYEAGEPCLGAVGGKYANFVYKIE